MLQVMFLSLFRSTPNKTNKDKEDKSYTLIQISHWDPAANEDKYCLVKVTNRDTAREAIKSALGKFKCGGQADDYQLWVKSGRDETYQLTGHEYPFTIKMNFVRDRLHRSADLQNMSHIGPDNTCLFILRKCYPVNKSMSTPLDNKKSSKKRRPINWPFKKTALKAYLSLDSGISSEPSTPTKSDKLFGQHLDLLCNNEELPKPLINMLKELFVKGPFTVGIFRKSANARVCKEFRAKLEADPNTDVTDVPVIVVASVFKEFLRSLPDCVLQSQLYSQWIEAITAANGHERRTRVQRLLDALPAANRSVLRHFLCALWHIAHKSSLNKMCSQNLGVCVGQSLLSPHAFGGANPVPPTTQRCEEMSKLVPKLVAYLIDHCPDLLGQNTLSLLGESPDLCDKERPHSGAEESDSLNSLPDNGVHSNTSSGGDSSIDSLERALMDDPSRVSPNSGPDSSVTFANKMSLSNLSRDSGLTLSDTQLYTPEDEDRDSDQYNSAYSPERKASPLVYPYLAKSVPHIDQTGLDSDINHTFSYGRSVGVSIDGSCHDVVMRKRRLQAIGQSPDYTHYVSRNSRPSNYRHDVNNHHFGNNHHNYRHNYRHQVLSAQPNHSSDHYSGGQHVPIHYSKSYSYGINRDDRTADDNSHREYRYRRPPLAAVLDMTNGYDQVSAHVLRRSNSAESLLYNSYDQNDSGFGSSAVHQCPQWSQQNSQFPNAVHNHSGGTQVTLRADVHHYEPQRNSNGFEPSSARLMRQESNGRCPPSDRVASICSSSSETASNRSSTLSKQSSNVSSRRSSSSARSGGQMSFPPTYEEAMNRKEMLCRAQSNTALNGTPLRKPSSASTTSANSSHIYEESVRIYNSDVDNKHNVTHRAVPVRVNACATDSDNSDIENVQLRRPHKQVVRAVSDGQSLLVNGSAGGRVVRISAQNFVSHSSHPSHPSHSSHLSSQPVSVLQRSAKDFAEEEWKKDINSNCNVATLRKLFNCSSLPVATAAATQAHANTYNIYVGRPSGRPTSVLIETNNNTKNCTHKQRPNSIEETVQKGVTVVHVGHSAADGQLMSVHKRADSVGNSSEEESYV